MLLTGSTNHLADRGLSETLAGRHAEHLIRLRDRLGSRFRTGLVIHAGSQHLPLGERVWAVPVSMLWTGESTGILA